MRMLKNLLAAVSALAAIIGSLLLILLLLGYRPFILLSPSMEPLYREGSLCIIDTRAELDGLAEGDVLAYRTQAGPMVFHRLISVSARDSDGLIAQTKGDANPNSQSVRLSKVNLVGREVFTVPELGSVIERIAISGNVGWYLAGLFLLLGCIPWKAIPALSGLPAVPELSQSEPQSQPDRPGSDSMDSQK